MEEKEVLQQLEIYFQKKYVGFNDVNNITKQFDDAFQYNDVETIRMLIKMRQQEIESIAAMDEHCDELLSYLTEEQKYALKEGDITPFSDESVLVVNKITEIRQKSKKLLEKIIEDDKRVNIKLARDKSYYYG